MEEEYCVLDAKTASKKMEALIHSEVSSTSINLPNSLKWKTHVVSRLVFLTGTWICQISYRNEYMQLLVQHLLHFMKHEPP